MAVLLDEGSAVRVFRVLMAIFVAVSGCWPHLSISDEGLEIVGVRRTRVRWDEIGRIEVGSQAPYFSRWFMVTQIWRLSPGPGMADRMAGRLIVTRSGRVLPVYSAQSPEFFPAAYVPNVKRAIDAELGARIGLIE